jgi:hypothetical protein
MAVEGPKRGEAFELILCACSNSFYTKARGIEYREANNPVTEVWRTWQRSSTDAMGVGLDLAGGWLRSSPGYILLREICPSVRWPRVLER